MICVIDSLVHHWHCIATAPALIELQCKSFGFEYNMTTFVIVDLVLQGWQRLTLLLLFYQVQREPRLTVPNSRNSIYYLIDEELHGYHFIHLIFQYDLILP